MPVLSPNGREQIWFLLFLAEICSFFHSLGNNFVKKQMFLTCYRNSSTLPAIVPVSGSIFGRRVDVSLKAGSLSVGSSKSAERRRNFFPGLFYHCTSPRLSPTPLMVVVETLHCWCCAVLLAGSWRGRVIPLSYPIPWDFDSVDSGVLWCVIEVILNNTVVE